jgi:predicted alpha/beta superfamily hydrolase
MVNEKTAFWENARRRPIVGIMSISCPMLRVILLFLFTGSLTGLAQDATAGEITLPGTQARTLYSETVGQEYRLSISLPRGYADSDQRYPVLYLLDAQWDFPLVYAIYGEQYYDGFVPGLIIVGISWGGTDPDPDALRLRDFTPTHVSGSGESGGAARFLSFFESELIPFIDRNYRSSDSRTLVGSSLGGLFALYALFTRPQLFDSYVATSPATPWDNGAVYACAEGFAERSARSPSRLYVAVSELEDLFQPVAQLVETLRQQAYPGLTWTSHVVSGAGHSGVKAEGNTRGLQYVFQRPDLALAATELERFTGSYHSADGQMDVRVYVEDGKLWGRVPAQDRSWQLNARDRTNFYHVGEFLNVRFLLDDDGAVTGFELHTYDGTTTYVRNR